MRDSTATQLPPTTHRIDFMRTFRNVDNAFSAYNEGRTIGEQLRTAHRSLMFEIIKAYAAQVNAKGYHDASGKMRPLHTTNALFAEIMGCHPRTIYRHIKRLQSARMIVRVSTHSRGFTIRLNYSLLSQGPNVAEVIEMAEPDNVASLVKSALAKGGMTSCTEKGNRNPTKELTSNVDKRNNLSDPNTQHEPTYKIHKGEGIDRAKTHKGEGQAADPVKMPTAASLSKTIALVAELWAWIEGNIYHRLDYLSDTQRAKGMAYLAAMILQAPPRQQLTKRLELRTRLAMVAEWLQRDPNRYIPIPSTYFDPDNPNGFKKTEIWFAQSVTTSRQLAEYREKYQIKAKQYRAFTSIVESWQSDPHNLDKYRALLQKASTYNPALGKAFNTFITNTLTNQN